MGKDNKAPNYENSFIKIRYIEDGNNYEDPFESNIFHNKKLLLNKKIEFILLTNDKIIPVGIISISSKETNEFNIEKLSIFDHCNRMGIASLMISWIALKLMKDNYSNSFSIIINEKIDTFIKDDMSISEKIFICENNFQKHEDCSTKICFEVNSRESDKNNIERLYNHIKNDIIKNSDLIYRNWHAYKQGLLNIDNEFEENFIKFWKSEKVFYGDNKIVALMNNISGIFTIIFTIALIIVSAAINWIVTKFKLQSDYALVANFILIILVILVLIFNLKNTKNKNLLQSRNLRELYKFLFSHNIKSYDDYSNLILRFEEKNAAIEYKYLVDDSLSNSLIKIGVFFGGSIFSDIIRYIGLDEKLPEGIDTNISFYLIMALVSFIIVCLYKLIIETFNNDNNTEKDNLILIIDDLKKIQFQIRKDGLEEINVKDVPE